MTSTFLDTPWKVDHLGAIQWILGRKTNSIQISWGQWKMIKWWINALRTMVFKESKSAGQAFRSLLGAMLFKDSQWFSELQQQLMSNAALEGHFIIVSLGYPLKHVISLNAHFTTWIWVMNIIDDANAFPFIIWFDKLRRIHEEEHWAYNDEPFLLQGMRFMSGWLDSSKKAGNNIYLKSIVSTGGKFMTD